MHKMICLLIKRCGLLLELHSFPTRRSSDLGVQNLFGDEVRRRAGALQVAPQRRVGLDRDGPVKTFGEPCSHLSVAGAGINKYVPGRQVIDQVAQPLLRLELLIGVIEKDLKGLVIFTTLRIVHGDRLCPSHSVLHRVYVRTLLSRLGGATPCAYAGPVRSNGWPLGPLSQYGRFNALITAFSSASSICDR